MILVAAVLALAVALAIPAEGQGFTWQIVLIIAGLTVVPFATVGLILQQIDVARFKRMRRGEGVLALWTVGSTQWLNFRASSREWDATPGGGLNTVDLAQEPKGDGVFISVSDNALLVGGDFHSIEKNASVRIYQGWMEFDLYISPVNGRIAQHVIQRFPIAPGSEAAAQTIANHYAAVYQVAVASSRIRIYLAIGLVGLPLLVGLFAWWFKWN